MKKQVYRKGAASFYVVAFSTLVLLIVVASFTALVIAQITRSSNDDLSQSAYDSALAGIEDAKLAYYNYQNCIAQGAVGKEPTNDAIDNHQLSCENIVWLVENANDDCDVVAKILGRNYKVDGVEVGVSIDEVNGQGQNRMQQYYTCVKIQNSLKDYRTSLSDANPMRAIKVKVDDRDDSENVNVDRINRIKVSWGSDLNASDVKLSNFAGGEVKYQKFTGVADREPANPPTIALAIAQAGEEFKMDDFKDTRNDQTNRGMLYLTPVSDRADATINGNDTFEMSKYENGMNVIDADALVNSNKEVASNKPYGVKCPNATDSEFACSTMINIPKPVGGKRADDNFIVAIMLPYGASTDVMLEFFCDTDLCGEERVFCNDDDPECDEDGHKTRHTQQVNLMGIQIGVDSTGKATDLFRRLDTRLEGSDSSSLSIMGPLELFGKGESGSGEDNNNVSFDKDYAVIKEWDF